MQNIYYDEFRNYLLSIDKITTVSLNNTSRVINNPIEYIVNLVCKKNNLDFNKNLEIVNTKIRNVFRK
jgi:hypothetical protein